MAKNVVVHLYYSFQLRPLVVAWQSDKLESVNYPKFPVIFFAFLVHLVGKQLAINAGLCKFTAG